jgi:hypothetical protein
MPLSRALLHLCLLGAASLCAATGLSLSGTVYDNAGAPLPGVAVQLLPDNLTDTTRIDGTWTLKDRTAGLPQTGHGCLARWRGNALRLDLAAAATVRVDAYDARGACLAQVAQRHLDAGIQELALPGLRGFSAAQWLVLRVDGQAQVLSAGGSAPLAGVLPGELGRAAADTLRRLSYTYQSQKVADDSVPNPVASHLTKWIQGIDVSCGATYSIDMTPDTIYARIYEQGNRKGQRQLPLTWSRLTITTNTYGGRIYLAKGTAGARLNYRLWADALDKSHRLTGHSDTIDVWGNTSAVTLGPFSVDNNFPSGRISGPDTCKAAQGGCAFALSLDRALPLARIEWDLADGGGFRTGGDSARPSWSREDDYAIQARVVTVDSFSSLLTKKVHYRIDSLHPETRNLELHSTYLKDTTLPPAGVAAFQLTTHAPDSLLKVLWNFGDGQVDSTFSGKVHSVRHRYPGPDTVQADLSMDYKLVATLIGPWGDTVTRTATVTVSYPRPVVSLGGIVELPGGLQRLHADAKAIDSIARYQWSVNGSPFRDGRQDTVLQLPGGESTVLARVIDAFGSASRMDTLRVTTDPRDGRHYRYVHIKTPAGMYDWFDQNLAFETDSSWWPWNSPDSGAKSGRLYTWTTALGLPDTCSIEGCAPKEDAVVQGICPVGWHLPSMADFYSSTAGSGLSLGQLPTVSRSPNGTFSGSGGIHTSSIDQLCPLCLGCTCSSSITLLKTMGSQAYPSRGDKRSAYSVRCVR